MQGENGALQSRVDDAASMLTDKDTLEATVKQQHVLIEKLDREVKVARGLVEERSKQVEKAA